MEQVSTMIIKSWAEYSDNSTFVFVLILYKLLCDEENSEICYLKDLKDLTEKFEEKIFLVFLDKMPQKQQDGFNKVLCLRDILRYLSIAPILRSTHTGDQDYVVKSSQESTSMWMHIISKPPPYKAS